MSRGASQRARNERRRPAAAVLLAFAALASCATKNAKPPPFTAGLAVRSEAVSLFSQDDQSIYEFDLANGASVSDMHVKPDLYSAWAIAGRAYGWEGPQGGATGLVAFDPEKKARQWIADKIPRGQIRWVDENFVYAGKSLIDRQNGAVLLEYRRLVRSGSPDLMVACDDSDRAFGVNPRNGSVYWQQGTCGEGVAVGPKRWARLRADKVELSELSTGAPIWVTNLPGRAVEHETAPPWSSEFELVSVDEERVYVAGAKGTLALAVKDGSELWRSPTGGRLAAKEGVVAVLRGFGVDVLDAASGKLRFRAAPPGDSRAGLRIAFGPGKLVVRTNKTLAAFDVATGKTVWSRGVDG